ncbi:MAG TPA: biotin--[acetyl-CoA-carboxylase] ligase [Polyangia bacterium]|jgi:BirA family biotin operon repressor/biotin-[acetyl-CoA-carboxylase] ligase|nr:biotin--[acetyl-CoA-carboxylase] ligase [Polyangia bacterium]
MVADPSLLLTADRVAAALGTRWLGRTLETHAACASTSDLAAERARAGAPAGVVIAADEQTAGRGRLGRSWHSPAGENLYVSLLLRPARPAAEIPPLTLLAGAAVARAIAPLGVSPRLKWPNDVQLVDAAGARRKLAGVLTEMASAGARVEHVVVGIGVNVNTTAFPEELAARATSLRSTLGRPVDRAGVLAAILNAFEPLYEDFERRGPGVAVAAFTEFAALPDRCRVDDRLSGVALGVDPDGALRLQDDAGQIHRVISGEVQP